MGFSFIYAKRAELPTARLCKTLEVSQSGYFVCRTRPASDRQRKDMVLFAYARRAVSPYPSDQHPRA